MVYYYDNALQFNNRSYIKYNINNINKVLNGYL